MDLPQDLIKKAYSERSSVVLTLVGSVIQHADHNKFLLVIGNCGGYVRCCVINSNLSRFAQSCDQPSITPEDLECLAHKSYVNCSEVVSIDTITFQRRIDEKMFIPKGHLAEDAMARVLSAGQQSSKLRPVEKQYFK